jgi:parvulin-like peptidyl-prolyl isomerase
MITRTALLGLLLSAPFTAGAHADPVAPGTTARSTTYAYLAAAATSLKASPCTTSKVDASQVRVSLFDESAAGCPIAKVGEDVIPLGELVDVLAEAHGEREESASSHAMDFQQPVKRLVDARLIAREAHEMGIDALPEVTQPLGDYASTVEKTVLQRSVTAKIGPEALDVERRYKSAIRQWKVTSVLFEKEADATTFKTAAGEGKKFDELARQAIADKKASGGEQEVLARPRMLEQVTKALADKEKGALAGPVQVSKGFAVLRLDELLYPDDPKALLDAKKVSVRARREDAVRRYQQSLAKKYAKVNVELVKKLDFEAEKPGFDALAKDQRVVASIQGEKPITVADLAAQLGKKFFHGVATPGKEHRLNPERFAAFEKLLTARLYAKEGAVRKIRKTPEYQRELDAQRRGLSFSAFLDKVLVPDVKVSEAEVKAQYDGNPARYTSPGMYRLESLSFTTAKGAEAVRAKLLSGTDWAFLRANADGQVKAEARTLALDGNLSVIASSLPEGLDAALAGARAGDYRIWAASPAENLVVRVIESTPPRLQPYPDAREAIARRIFDEKLAKALDAYVAKLREARPVEVYLTRIGT